jgi:hypothetical protein
MKRIKLKIMKLKLLFIALIFLAACNQNNLKETELREREIAIREKELGINKVDTTIRNSSENNILNDTIKTTTNQTNRIETTQPKIELSKEDKWEIFWTNFKSAFENKDKAKIKSLTARDFFDGGGGDTILEWLENRVFSNTTDYDNFLSVLYGGVKEFKNQEGKAYKATGNNEMGDLYFDYFNGKWIFGGVMGD